MAGQKSLLVIGGTGFIGKALAKKARDAGYQIAVYSLHGVQQDSALEEVEYLQVDIADSDAVKSHTSKRKFTHVINLGGYVNHAPYRQGGREVIQTHFSGVQNLVQSLNWDTLESFIQVGSSDEYGAAASPQKEDMRELPISPYSFGKAAAGQLLQMLHRTEGFPAVMCRLFLVYGPGQNNQRFLPQIIAGCINDEVFPTSFGEQLRDFCHIDDIASAFLLALETGQAQGEVFNIASGQPVSIRSVIEQVIEITGRGEAKFGEIAYRKGENMSLYADITKAQQLLSWAPEISLSDGLNQTIEYYRSQLQ